ncbi:hypothetical protein TcCL_Unassigned05194 [Trypanosoma cruzi]|nr:hypothetical protein TcCL_Unassigned05194 [Trypanosoma cruzi]
MLLHVWMFGAAGAPHAESMARRGSDLEKGHRVGRQSSLQRPPPNLDVLASSAVPVTSLTYFCAEDCAAGPSSAMFGRRSMARTNDLREGDVHCDEKEKNSCETTTTTRPE